MVSVLLPVFVSLVIPVFSVLAQGKVEVTDWYLYENSAGYAVYGEVKNVSDQTVSSVTCSVTWYSEDGEIVATGSWDTWLSKIGTGKTAPFAIPPTEIVGQVEKADKSKLRLSWSISNSKPKNDVRVIKDKGWADEEEETYKIIGEIKNYEDKPVSRIVIWATMYDKKGNVVAVGGGQSNLDLVPSGGTSPFRIGVFHPIGSAIQNKVATYNLDIQYSVEE